MYKGRGPDRGTNTDLQFRVLAQSFPDKAHTIHHYSQSIVADLVRLLPSLMAEATAGLP